MNLDLIPDPSGHVAVWACFCSDAADDPADLPARCPHHDRALIAPIWTNDRPGPVATGHRCPTAPIPEGPRP